MATNTNPARGMRDFLPADVRKRTYVIGIIREVYEKYGFEPLETPSVENLSTLTNKYGEEGDQLMFKILKRGEKLQKKLEKGEIRNENELADLALRYDLTVPLARVIANYRNDLPKFFKRYQIQPVWRADRPAKGRYREFYQCDVDAIGSNSMIVEAELCSAVSEILEKLGFEDFTIRVNHREILRGLLIALNIPIEHHTNVLVIVDKLDKIGETKVREEITDLGIEHELVNEFINTISPDPIGQILYDYNLITQGNENILSLINETAENYLTDQVETKQEISKVLEELRLFLNLVSEHSSKHRILLYPNLVRGLSYYTGAIFEIALTKGDFAGSIGGGGRYDGLIGMFGKEEIPAVGFSLGLERIIYVMEERGMFPDDLQTNAADVLVTVWNEETAGESLKLAGELRQKDLRVFVYPQVDKLGKQFKYADQIDARYVCVLGENELKENTVSLKNLKSGEQETVAREEIAEKIKT